MLVLFGVSVFSHTTHSTETNRRLKEVRVHQGVELAGRLSHFYQSPSTWRTATSRRSTYGLAAYQHDGHRLSNQYDSFGLPKQSTFSCHIHSYLAQLPFFDKNRVIVYFIRLSNYASNLMKYGFRPLLTDNMVIWNTFYWQFTFMSVKRALQIMRNCLVTWTAFLNEEIDF